MSEKVMFYTKESIWTTHEGRRIPFDKLEDTHLANIINFIEKSECRSLEVLIILKDISKERGLKKEFLERAQIPYKNKNNKWEIFNFKEHTFQEVEE